MKPLFLSVFALFFMASASQAQYLRAKPVTVEGVISKQTLTNALAYPVKVPVYSITNQASPVTTTCTQVVCSDIPSDGTKGDWKGFFNAPRTQKAQALADAVKGIGIATAQKIIEDGTLFTSKPRSWDAFTQEVLRAEQSLSYRGYNYRFASQVIYTYGDENARNLGYYSDAACREVQTTCTTWVNHEVETFAYTLDRTVTVQVKNAVLQDFESEKYRITVGMQPNDIQIDAPNTYNTYDASVLPVSSNLSVITLTALKRNRVSLPADTGKASFFKTNDGMQIAVSLNPNYLPAQNDPGSNFNFVYRVCNANFFGGCHQEIVTWTWQNANNQSSINIKVPANLLKKGDKYKVWYKFVRSGSRFYNDQANEDTTSSVKF